jgi:hypothetical protein
MIKKLILLVAVFFVFIVAWRTFYKKPEDSLLGDKRPGSIIDILPGQNDESKQDTSSDGVETNEVGNTTRDSSVDNKTNSETNNTNTPNGKKNNSNVQDSLSVVQSLESQIINKYKQELSNLRDQLMKELFSLASQAKDEYFSLPENKRVSSATSLAFKYYRKAAGLEKEGDKKVEVILSRMTQELKSNNLSTEAVTIARNQYIIEKKDMKKKMMAKFKEFM